MTKKSPIKSSDLFKEKSVFIRSVHKDYVLSGNRVSPAAFEPAPADFKSGLSVNSLEMESLDEITSYFRENYSKLGQTEEAVAYADHKVSEYNQAAKKADVSISKNQESATWEYKDSDEELKPAYEHRPVRPYVSEFGNEVGSPSHCGVMFVRAIKEGAIKRYSVHLSRKKCHVKAFE